jgi:hypothetical protein
MCKTHPNEPAANCLDCLGEELIRLRHIVAFLVWKGGGRVVLTHQDTLALPETLSVREHARGTHGDWVIETVDKKTGKVASMLLSLITGPHRLRLDDPEKDS